MAPRNRSLLADLIAADLVQDGELLRYKNRGGTLMAVGRAHENGIHIHGSNQPYTYSAFEKHAGEAGRHHLASAPAAGLGPSTPSGAAP